MLNRILKKLHESLKPKSQQITAGPIQPAKWTVSQLPGSPHDTGFIDPSQAFPIQRENIPAGIETKKTKKTPKVGRSLTDDWEISRDISD